MVRWLAGHRNGFGRRRARCGLGRVARADRVGRHHLRDGARAQGEAVEAIRRGLAQQEDRLSRHSRQVRVHAAGTDRAARAQGREIPAIVSGEASAIVVMPCMNLLAVLPEQRRPQQAEPFQPEEQREVGLLQRFPGVVGFRDAEERSHRARRTIDGMPNASTSIFRMPRASMSTPDLGAHKYLSRLLARP